MTTMTRRLPKFDTRFHRAIFVASCDPDCDGWTTSVWRIVIPADIPASEAFEHAWSLIPCSQDPLDECFQMTEREVIEFFATHRPHISDQWHEWQHPTLKVESIHHRSAWGVPR